MNITVSTTSSTPIYQQLVDRVKALIVKGELRPGDALPSMRLLAKELRISVITTKRAYEELEREGLITSMTGRGSFVRGDNASLIRESGLREMESAIEKAAELAKRCSLGRSEFIDACARGYDSDEQY